MAEKVMRVGRFLAIAAFCAVSALPAHAGDIADFDTALANAWAHCRDALYQSRPGGGDQPATSEALAAFVAAWDELEERWGDAPPPHYSEDVTFSHELAQVGEVGRRAAAFARTGRVGQAHAALSQIPALLAEMRRKNGIETYTDHLDAFAEALAEITDDSFDTPELSPRQVVLLVKHVGALAYLGERLEKRAPARLAGDEAFLALLETLNAELRSLEAAAIAGQRTPVRAVLSDIRRTFERLYLFYG